MPGELEPGAWDWGRSTPWTGALGLFPPAPRQPRRELDPSRTVWKRSGSVPTPRPAGWVIYVAAPPTRGTDVLAADEDEVAEVNETDQLLPGMFEPVREHLTRTLED